MKKIILLLLVLIGVVSISACDTTTIDEPTEWVVLPDLNGLKENEIILFADQLGINYEIGYLDQQSSLYSLQFVMYTDHSIGDIVSTDELITIIVYPQYISANMFELPDFSGLLQEEVLNLMLNSTISYYFESIITDNLELVGYFAGFVGGYLPGEYFNTTSALGILIYELEEQLSGEYFQVVDMVYDGPYLDESYANINYLDPRGGYFEVTLLDCTDGDTAQFNYPLDIYQAITSGAKSTRFLNMDTEETYSGGREEWGKPGSLYTCSLLNSAESIIIQTDPGDGLLGTYGRLLGWIWIQLPNEEEYFLLNYMVVKQGLAQVKYEFGAGETLSYGDYTYNEWMHIAEDYAIANDLGQWGDLLDYYWNYETDEPYLDRWYNN